MAKWGEGDPRWIVEERPDATNVNNWHWTEKNASPWSKDRLKELLKNLKIERDDMSCVISEVETLEGEASANNRKGKLIFFYEWDIVLKWQGTVGDGESIEGKVKIPNLSEENDVSEVDISISVKSTGSDADKLKTFMYNVGREEIRNKLGLYVSSLKEEFSKGMILPRKDDPKIKPDAVSSITSGFNKKIDMVPIESNKSSPCTIDVTTINLKHKFQCKAQEFYDAMTRIEMVTAFTRGAVQLDASKGGNFKMFGGNITGTFQELVPAKKIVQTWRYKQWPEGHHSKVTIDIDEKTDHTEVTITQVGVPKSEVEITTANWERYYWESMKRTFGFGAFFT
ncbi:activator of 90 kDa heat shock protein ATPase homolog 1 [Ctenocephalides felis]|uniref:activator of 90 kDa heat shock protein ATPase homolog 1 n=1 Tax=Ctenocephalides felis TaxID=7515 RepID=UPI000E6E20FF|nr:activator of 90 kDa heat shock protein ATPase homolog 1 [Ctenocephalides felis]